MEKKVTVINSRKNPELRQAMDTINGKKNYIKHWKGKWPRSSRILILALIAVNAYQFLLSRPDIVIIIKGIFK